MLAEAPRGWPEGHPFNRLVKSTPQEEKKEEKKEELKPLPFDKMDFLDSWIFICARACSCEEHIKIFKALAKKHSFPYVPTQEWATDTRKMIIKERQQSFDKRNEELGLTKNRFWTAEDYNI